MIDTPVVSRDEWIAARRELLAKEKELTRLRDRVSAERRALPRVVIEKPYVFVGPNGRESLSDLFGRRTQLVVYHFMFGPDWQEGCKSCSFVSDHVDGALPHLAARDVAFAAVSRAPYEKLAAFRRRMGWRFHWVSSLDSDFNADFHVSFTREDIARGNDTYNFGPREDPTAEGEAPGASVFYRDERGRIFHTYSTYARGLDPLVGAYQWLDLVPKGRDEDGLSFTMAWVRHHDRYGE